jgi:hypothetical protein
MPKCIKVIALLFLVTALIAPAAFAQSGTGRIGGKVVDQQAGVLPGANVQLVNIDSGLAVSVVTNAAGVYNFAAVDPGNYRMQVSLSGFANWVREPIILVVRQGLTIDVTMAVAGVAETVTVTSESPMISTRDSEVGGVVDTVEVQNVPINTRDVQQLALLVPGAKRANNFDPTKGRVPAISLGTNGSGRGVLYMLDGGDNTDDAVGGIVQQVSMDAVQEFAVVTSRIKAEYARAGGGAITMVTKSGTNEFHGTGFWLFRDKALNAETEPEKIVGEGKPDYRRNQFGGTLGGPVVQDKAFFFVTYERLKEDSNSTLGVTPEVEAAFDPALIAEHGGFGNIAQPFKRNYFTAKYTQQFNPANRVDVRYAYEDNNLEGDQVGRGFNFNRTFDQAGFQTNESWSILARFQTIFGTGSLNEFVFQLSDFENIIQGVDQPDFHTPAGPTLDFPGVRMGQHVNVPQSTFQRKLQLRDTFSMSVNSHDLKFGGGMLRGDPFGFDLPFSNNGFFAYANDGDALDQAFNFTQFDLIPPLEIPYTVYGFFVQDDWRIGESLTLNLGIRYDYESGVLSNVPYGVNGFRLIEDPRSPYFGQANCSGDFNGVPNSFCLEDDGNNFAPRLGFAYDIGARGQTVIRGGWGRFYDKIIANATLFTLIDAVGIRGVSILTDPGELPFGPDAIPSFDEIFADFGFPLPFDRIITPIYEVPYSDQFTIGVSHQITPQIAFDVDYVRSDGKDRGKRSDLNEMRVPNVQASRLFNDGTIPDRQFGGRLRVVDPFGEDTYDGVQFSVRKRFSNRSQFTVNYTYADLRGNSEASFANEAECRACIGDDRDIGPYENDTTHNFITGGIYQFPGDWQISGLFQAESGRPLTAQSSLDLNGNGRRASTGDLDLVAGPNGEPAGRGNFNGESTITLDLRVAKFINFGGAKQLQVFAEFFNLFNRVNRGRNFGENVDSAQFGLWDQAGLITNQFQMQIGARFNF